MELQILDVCPNSGLRTNSGPPNFGPLPNYGLFSVNSGGLELGLDSGPLNYGPDSEPANSGVSNSGPRGPELRVQT